MTALPETHRVGNRTTVWHPSDIETRRWRELSGFSGVTYRLLWREGGSVAGIMHVRPRHALDEHVHPRADHHMWVLRGVGTLGDERVTPGCYAHIPAGVSHGITDVGEDGCTVLYLYLEDRPV